MFVKHRPLRKKDFLVLLFIRPPFTILINYFIFGMAYFTDAGVCIPVSAVSVVTTVLTWRIHIYFDHITRSRYSEFGNVVKRLYLVAGVHLVVAVTSLTFIYIFYDYVHFAGYSFAWPGYFKGLMAGFCTNLAAIGFHEGVYMLDNWKKTWLEAEELKKNNLRSQLAGLKNQVNPHFLFNSINTLSSLIEENTEEADRFLNELSKVYRYLLQVEREHLTTLKKEQAFIRSWFYILKTRYGEGITLEMDIKEEDENKYIPTLTIQVVMENAMEMNRLSKKQPLQIIIRTQKGNALTIVNKIIAKTNPKPENHNPELDHLMNKFRLMGINGLKIEQREDWRWVTIPLILSNAWSEK